MRRAALLVSLLLLAVPTQAEVTLQPVLGEFEFEVFGVSCPSQPSGCFTCVNDALTTADHRLMVALGETYPNNPTTGLAEGILRPFVMVDGVRLDPPLLPCASRFRSGVRWSDLPLAQPCSGTPKGVEIQVGDVFNDTVSGDGEAFFDIPVEDADAIAFRFSLCSQFVYWGAGCNVSGSSNKGFRLILPGELRALEVQSGDAPTIERDSVDLRIDFVSGPGGRVAIGRATGDAPGTPFVPQLNGYWDLKTDMAEGSFVAELVLKFTPAEFPGGVVPPALVVARYDQDSGDWLVLNTQLRLAENEVAVQVDRLGKFVLLASGAVATEASNFGAVKARF